ncbi:U3 snoRNP protein [Saxophila tyrrhenica]|uniref:U3 snoRNP protein n=1 Tax=Saxophila tyrrhenica TaxID=1690608 RepID=A0AAV9PBR0_9PEZI|nr:U3 snoRNP protein [Saxophila tyrrhenica]
MAAPGRKKATKPSKVVKPSKNTRRSTASTKNHRFQSFSERISKLKIDPIRRKRKAEEQEELSQATETYFGRAFEEWRDLNMSKTFTAFAKEVAPLCDSLAMILYHEEKIMDILDEYIRVGDPLAMEPILSLLSHFAHDLDVRFEKHFQRAVATITSVAASNEDPAAVEWCFNSLAWLFKYLSRVLTPDLRPVYDLMSPYMGKTRQKPFIIRFAAESQSFLIRKAAATYERDPVPLDLIIGHALEDCQASSDHPSADFYRQGVMTLLTEAIKGVQNGVHSSGPATIQSLLKEAEQSASQSQSQHANMLTGIVTSLIHHTTPETFQPLLHTILQHVDASLTAENDTHLPLHSRLVYTMVSVRKGARVSDWSSTISTLREMMRLATKVPDDDLKTRYSILSALAVALQSAPIDAVLPALNLLPTLRTEPWASHFLHFCDLYARLGQERFQSFLLPELQRFVVEQWQRYTSDILLLLPRVLAPNQQITCPVGMQQNIKIQLRSHPQDTSSLHSLNTLLVALPHLKIDDSRREAIKVDLLGYVEAALGAEGDDSTELRNFGLGACFQTVLNGGDASERIGSLWPLLCQISRQVINLSQFWGNMLRYVQLYPPGPELMDGSETALLEESLIQCLSMSSHDIRDAALNILQQIYKLQQQPVPEVLSAAVTIESTPISLEASRGISMNIRRLGLGYSNAQHDSLVQKAIPRYCFGLLHIQLTPAWNDAIDALAEMSKDPVAEGIITSLSQAWLEGQTTNTSPLASEEHDQVLNVETSGFRVFSDFECSNMVKMMAICDQVFEAANHGYPSIEEQFNQNHEVIPMVSTNARQQALRVLNKMPNIAEKKSRMLVPVLLSWASSTTTESDDAAWSHGWSRKDQKAMLALFAQFTNPKVLFRSGEVYDALLNLCANGDVEIQRSALKAILAWKDPAVTRYAEQLTNLLDEARFRDEVAVFLQSEHDDEAAIRPEHKPTLMPVLLRLLYGRAVAGGKEGQRARRRTIFMAISRFGQEIVEAFVDIALASAGIPQADAWESLDQALAQLKSPARQQFGMLNMFDDLLSTLGLELESSGEKLLNAILLCTIAASRKLNASEDEGDLKDGSLLRSVRQVGMQCLAKVYLGMENNDFSGQMKLVASELLMPRKDKFATENTQSISGSLRLLSAWSMLMKTASYMTTRLGYVLDGVAELLVQETAKDDVRLFVLQGILDNLADKGGILAEAHVTAFVQSIGSVINRNPSSEVLGACVTSFSKLAECIKNQTEAEAVMNVCTSLLTKPSKLVSPRTKIGLLSTLEPLLKGFDVPAESPLYIALSGLFSRMRSDDGRHVLSAVFGQLCKKDEDLAEAASICADLNATGSRLDQADDERRERGFVKIFEGYEDFSLQMWQPIVHNCLYFIRDAEDMVNRANAARALERFVAVSATKPTGYGQMITTTILPSIEHGMAESSELVRAEYVRLLGHVVEKVTDMASVSDLQVLTVGGDDEASFFTNVLHIQQHRRLRALRRLADEANGLSSSNATKYLIPLLEHFVFNPAEGDAGRTLADQTVSTLGALANVMKWSSFRFTFKRYTGLLKSQPDHEKVVLRLLGVLVDALHSQSRSGWDEATIKTRADIIVRDFLPPLMAYLHLKDESTVDRRMPVAVTIVKLLQLLPEEEMSIRLAPVLTDVCHVLRSRSIEARDQTRKALAAILGLVGPAYFGFLLKELRVALQRGYQLHVLSFTVHSLLVHAIDQYQPGDLDHCLSQLAMVIMDDIFGVTGQEKEAEEYKTGMKEIKSSKSYDTMELLARVTPVQRLGRLIQPVRTLLMERLDFKSAEKIDSLLARLRKGLDQNPAAESRDMLTFCHEIVRHVYAEQSDGGPRTKEADPRRNRYLIKPERRDTKGSKTATTSHIFKLVSFALNLLRKVLRRHEDLQTPGNLAGFLPMAGDALVQSQEEVQVSAMRLLSTIMRVPIPELETDAPVYAKEAVRTLKATTSINTDAARGALELLTAVLREKRSVPVKGKDIGDVLKTIKVDIDEPDKQGVVYKFLRAVVGRKIMITEVYEIMDEVSKVVVTNADRNVRDGARSAYIHFIMEYPQGKDRWNKQAAFFVENLKYEHPAGRQSTMELLHQLLLKVQDDVLAQLAFTLFVALVPVQVSDTNFDCRHMAGILIAKLFERADDEHYSTYVGLLEKWLRLQGNPTVQNAALQCWQVCLRTRLPATRRLETLRNEIDSMLDQLKDGEAEATDEVANNALQTFDILLDAAPVVAFSKKSASIWEKLRSALRFSKSEIKIIAARMLERLFSDVASTSSKLSSGLSAVPLRGSQGLELHGDDLRWFCAVNIRVLLSHSDDTEGVLPTQTARNLAFLGRCFAANNMTWRADEGTNSDDEEVETPDTGKDPSAIAYLLNRLSYIIRQERIAISCRLAAIECQISLVNHVSTLPDLAGTIRPAYLLTDNTIPQQLGEAHGRLVEKASELLELLQKKVGSTTYLSALGNVRGEAKARREERRQKRKIEAVSAPERWAKDKRKKHDARKVTLKARASEARGKRRGW